MAMYHNQDQQAADLANAKAGICPECLADMTKFDPVAHAEAHWTEQALREHELSDAHRRKALILTYAQLRPADVTQKHVDQRAAMLARVEDQFHEATGTEVAKAS